MNNTFICDIDHSDFDMVLALQDFHGASDKHSARSICHYWLKLRNKMREQ